MFSHRRIVFILILLPLFLIPCRMTWTQETSANNQQIESEEGMLRKIEKDIQSLDQPIVWDESCVVPRLYKELKIILQVYPNTLSRDRIEATLSKVQEILAVHNLEVARFYVIRAKQTGAAKGAETRLLTITRDFPKFSRMDEVFLLLGKAYLIEEHTEDAANSFWKVICKYPSSKFVNEAFEYLNRIGFSASGCGNLKP